MPINSPATGLSQSVPGYLSKFEVATISGGSPGSPVEFGEMDEFDYTKTRDVLDATSHQSGGWKTSKPGLASWTATAKGLHLAADVTQLAMRNAISGATLLYFTLYPEGVGSGLSILTGAGYIKDVKFTSPVKDLSKAEFSIEGSGPLTESTQ